MKIKTNKANRKNISVQLITGVIVAFNNEGVGELNEEDMIQEIMDRDPSISTLEDFMTEPTEEEIHENPLVEGKIIDAEAEIEALAGGEEVMEGILEKAEDTDEVVGEAFSLNELTVPELREVCKEAGLEGKEWRNLSKAKLILYIAANTEE